MRDVHGSGCNEPGVPNRADLPMHDLTGGNAFIPDILPILWPSEGDSVRLQAGKARVLEMLSKAATLTLSKDQVGANPLLTVKVVNETGHKLPTGYPEGRRMWLNVKAYDSTMARIYESGEYDFSTGTLIHDPDVKIHEIKPGISTRLAPIVGLPSGPSFHFLLNDTVYKDNRIPPRGFTNSGFDSIQSPVVGYSYADSQYWDETSYLLPEGATHAEVTLYYQTTTREYVEFLRDENVTNDAGQTLYDAWVAQGKGPPVAMASDTIDVTVTPTSVAVVPVMENRLYQNVPNPFNPFTRIGYALKEPSYVSLDVYDVSGRHVRTLVRARKERGAHVAIWDGLDEAGNSVASGVYFYRIQAGVFTAVKKAVLLK